MLQFTGIIWHYLFFFRVEVNISHNRPDKTQIMKLRSLWVCLVAHSIWAVSFPCSNMSHYEWNVELDPWGQRLRPRMSISLSSSQLWPSRSLLIGSFGEEDSWIHSSRWKHYRRSARRREGVCECEGCHGCCKGQWAITAHLVNRHDMMGNDSVCFLWQEVFWMSLCRWLQLKWVNGFNSLKGVRAVCYSVWKYKPFFQELTS